MEFWGRPVSGLLSFGVIELHTQVLGSSSFGFVEFWVRRVLGLLSFALKFWGCRVLGSLSFGVVELRGR